MAADACGYIVLKIQVRAVAVTWSVELSLPENTWMFLMRHRDNGRHGFRPLAHQSECGRLSG